MRFYIRPPLKESTKVYRYITFSQFASLVEQRKFYLTRVQKWEDTWEIPSIAIPTKKQSGEVIYEKKFGEERLYGSCWTRHRESDAMWRIYAPLKDGVMIKTSVRKFKNLNFTNGYISEVYYYSSLNRGLEKTLTDPDFWLPYSLGLLKRKAFKHEREVRFLYYHNPMVNELLEPNKLLLGDSDEKPNYIYSSFDPIDFIEGVTIDPRSDDWFAEMVKLYCKRAGFRFTPKKSNLYSKNIYGETGLRFIERTIFSYKK